MIDADADNNDDDERCHAQCLLDFLARVAARSEDNKMNALNLALVFAPNLFSNKNQKNLSDETAERNRQNLQAMTLKLMIENHDRIFMIPPNLISQYRFSIATGVAKDAGTVRRDMSPSRFDAQTARTFVQSTIRRRQKKLEKQRDKDPRAPEKDRPPSDAEQPNVFRGTEWLPPAEPVGFLWALVCRVAHSVFGVAGRGGACGDPRRDSVQHHHDEQSSDDPPGYPSQRSRGQGLAISVRRVRPERVCAVPQDVGRSSPPAG